MNTKKTPKKKRDLKKVRVHEASTYLGEPFTEIAISREVAVKLIADLAEDLANLRYGRLVLRTGEPHIGDQAFFVIRVDPELPE